MRSAPRRLPPPRRSPAPLSPLRVRGSTVTGIATLLSLPLQNFNTAVNTVGQLLVFIKGLNSAMGHLYTGDWAAIPTDLAKAFTDEVTAIKNVFALPGKLIAYDLGVIRGVVGATATVAAATPVASSRVQTLALTAAPSTEAARARPPRKRRSPARRPRTAPARPRSRTPPRPRTPPPR